MSPTHHLPASWIVAWAAGTMDPAREVLAAAHLTLCPHCRYEVRQAEQLGGAVLDRAIRADTAPAGSFDALMARIDEPEREPTRSTHDPSGVLPASVARYTGPYNDVRWRWLAPRVHGVTLDVPTSGLPLRLIRIAAGHRLPLHDHAGAERGLVLRGGWRDQTGHYRRGDACFVDPDLKGHEQVMDTDTDCIALVLNDGPIEAHNPILRLAARLLGV